jgi:hypothetical protein
MSEWEQILTFPEGERYGYQNDLYVKGFEAGRIYEQIRRQIDESGRVELRATIHTTNVPLLEKIAEHFGCLSYESLTDARGWMDIRFTSKPRNI